MALILILLVKGKSRATLEIGIVGIVGIVDMNPGNVSRRGMGISP